MITYKGTDKYMQCHCGFQYELGKEYADDGAIRCGIKGFHSCKAPLDVFSYFHPKDGSRFFICEADGEISEGTEDSKIASSLLKLKTEITIPALVKAQIEYVKEHTTTEHTDQKMSTAGDFGAATAGDSGAATAGEYGASTAGYRGVATAGNFGAATAGDSGAATAGDSGAATAGNSGVATAGNFGAATAGDSGAATSGNFGASTAGDFGAATAGDGGAATAGEYGASTAGYRGVATAGNFGAATAGDGGVATSGNFGAATAGDSGAATARGSVSVGVNGVGLVRGSNVKIRGGIGAILTIAEENKCDYNIKYWKSFVVDGEFVKPDTWYKLVNGEIVEADD